MKDGNIIQEIFENPALIENLSMDSIDAWIEEAPYVQYLHLLKALKLKSLGITDPKSYHKSATVVTDRIRMNELLESLNHLKSKKNSPKLKGANQDKTSKKKSKILKNPKEKGTGSSTQKNEPEKGTKNEKSISDKKKTYKHDRSEELKTDFMKSNEDLTKNKANGSKRSLKDITDESTVEEKESRSESRVELSEFSEWLLALDGRGNEIDDEQIDQSVSIDGAAISETLAVLMEKQGHIDKAIEMYEKLSLINPEKSAYFAALIEKLKKQ